jgi:hypothetical protein
MGMVGTGTAGSIGDADVDTTLVDALRLSSQALVLLDK